MKMDVDLKQKWVGALLSGKYPQGSGYLHYKGKYCCLGVLAEICGTVISTRAATLDDIRRDDLLGPWTSTDCVPYDMYKPETMDTNQKKLAAMNDRGLSFKEIAAYIQENL